MRDQERGDASGRFGTSPVPVYRCLHNNNHFTRRTWMNIYVGQLPYSAKAEDLRTIFSAFGEIASLNLITDKFTGQSKGFAFVEMPNNAEADKAIKALNKTMFQGREIKVNQAEARREKSPYKKRW
jgi:RNA recognition motif-containing protein